MNRKAAVATSTDDSACTHVYRHLLEHRKDGFAASCKSPGKSSCEDRRRASMVAFRTQLLWMNGDTSSQTAL